MFRMHYTFLRDARIMTTKHSTHVPCPTGDWANRSRLKDSTVLKTAALQNSPAKD